MQHQIQSVAIVGAGAMGRSIAALNVKRGIPVTIADKRPHVLKAAQRFLKTHAESHNRARPGTETVPPHQLVRVTEDPADLAAADLVIEAVAERLRVKRQLLVTLAPHLKPTTIVATNTSSIALSNMVNCLPHRERFCGLHFCYPVDQRPLVEVVRGTESRADTIAAVEQYAQRLDKKPIIVRDRPGFVVNRLLVPYLNEALELILEGASVDQVEKAAVDFGMPIGPLHQLDQFGIDIALQTGATLYKAFPNRVLKSSLLIAMYEAGRLGQKTGGGFFEVREAGEARLATQSAELIEQSRRAHSHFSSEHLTQRLFLPMLLEAMRILEEQVVPSATDVDSALCDGLDFNPPYGGLLRWAENTDPRNILDWLTPLQPLGARFHPTSMLLDLVRSADFRSDAA